MSKMKSGLTKRAVDGGDSAAFSGFFYTRTESCSWSFIYARPTATNASRWAFLPDERSNPKMTLDQFLTLVATIFGAVGSIYVLKSILRLTPEITERLSATMFGHNPDQIDSLSTQKSEGVVGTSLIAIALFIAIANAAATPTNIIVHHSRLYAILSSIILSVLVYSLLLIVGKVVNSHHRLATARIIAAKTLDRLFKNKSIPNYEIKSLRHLNDKYLHLELSPEKTSKDLLRLIANDVGRTVPEDIQIEGESPS